MDGDSMDKENRPIVNGDLIQENGLINTHAIIQQVKTKNRNMWAFLLSPVNNVERGYTVSVCSSVYPK